MSPGNRPTPQCYADEVIRALRLLLLGTAAAIASAQTPGLVDVLRDELLRNFEILSQKADPKAYFLSYSVVDDESFNASATLGSLLQKGGQRSRIFDASIRVGTPQLDNYHRLRGERAQFAQPVMITMENTPNAIRRRVWMETDRAYRLAAERLIRVKTDTQVKAEAEDRSDDFSVEPAVQFAGPVVPLKFDNDEWIARIRKVSQEFAKYPWILNSQVAVQAQRQTKYLVNSEGTRVQHGRGFFRVAISAAMKAPVDGMELGLFETLDAEDGSDLPSEEKLRKSIQKMAADLDRLAKAPVVEPFVGPAILSGRAAGVFFHEIFGHRIEGHRQKDESEGQTFSKSIGQPVLPEFLSVVFDATRKSAEGVDLNGWYRYDDEGVAARRVPVVERGVLKTFLMSRSPVRGFTQSNGHGRKAPGAEAVSRQSNLFVESSKKVSDAQLRQMLIEEARKQGKPYGLFFETVTGGYTTTGRQGLQAFTVMPLVVYRVYVDGRPDEAVRGVDIVGTPLTSFSKIMATSDRNEVFNGICGAESGAVPVSAIAPALLVSEIEVQKKQRSMDRPPILPRPEVQEESK